MSRSTPAARIDPSDSWSRRAKASVAGGAAATLLAPLLFFATVLLTPASNRGFWTNPLDVLFAFHAIWLFAGLAAIPVSDIAGPPLLLVAGRAPLPTGPTAIALGAVLGALVINALPFLTGANWAMSLPPAAFAASLGAVGAGVAAKAWNWLNREATPANAA